MASKRIIGHVDSDGQLHEGSFVALIYKKHINGFERWFAMSQDAMMMLEMGNFGPKAKVFFSVMARLDFENWINFNQAQVAKKIGLREQHYNRAIKALEKDNIIIRGPKVGRTPTFRLNPNYGWKGSAKNHKEALKEKMDKIGMYTV